jgi:hypothetical protein
MAATKGKQISHDKAFRVSIKKKIQEVVQSNALWSMD